MSGFEGWSTTYNLLELFYMLLTASVFGVVMTRAIDNIFKASHNKERGEEK